MQKIELKFTDQKQVALEVTQVHSNSTLVVVKDLLQQSKQPVLLTIEHSKITTHLELTTCEPHHLILFRKDKNNHFVFDGVAVCNNKNNNSFGMLVQATSVLFIPNSAPVNFKFNNIAELLCL